MIRVGGGEDGEPGLGPDDACPTPHLPVQSQNWIKRVIIGLPGDTVEVHDSQIIINGKPVIDDEIGPFKGNPQREEDAQLLNFDATVWNEHLGYARPSDRAHAAARPDAFDPQFESAFAGAAGLLPGDGR